MNVNRILIVEDNPSHMQLAAYILEHSGYEVLQAADADQGIALARKERPALILMDLRLPGKDGLTAVRELKGDPETGSISIIAVTSYRDQYSEETIRLIGADGFILKPYHYDHFLATVRTVLDRSPAP